MERQNKLKDSLLRFLSDLFDLMVLNWLWLLCSLPIVTIGPATCGLYSVTLKLAREEPVSAFRAFFRGFCRNLKAGILLGLFSLVLLAAAVSDACFAMQQTGWLQMLYLVAAVIIAVIWLIVNGYVFALQAMFDSKPSVQILNAFKLTAVAPGKSIKIWVFLLLPVILMLVLPPVALKMLGFLYICLGVSAPVYFAGRIQRDVFDYVNGGPVVEPLPPEEE